MLHGKIIRATTITLLLVVVLEAAPLTTGINLLQRSTIECSNASVVQQRRCQHQISKLLMGGTAIFEDRTSLSFKILLPRNQTVQQVHLNYAAYTENAMPKASDVKVRVLSQNCNYSECNLKSAENPAEHVFNCAASGFAVSFDFSKFYLRRVNVDRMAIYGTEDTVLDLPRKDLPASSTTQMTETEATKMLTKSDGLVSESTESVTSTSDNVDVTADCADEEPTEEDADDYMFSISTVPEEKAAESDEFDLYSVLQDNSYVIIAAGLVLQLVLVLVAVCVARKLLCNAAERAKQERQCDVENCVSERSSFIATSSTVSSFASGSHHYYSIDTPIYATVD